MMRLSQDHNTSNARERERVTAMGGVIKDNRVGGVLIPTRWGRCNSHIYCMKVSGNVSEINMEFCHWHIPTILLMPMKMNMKLECTGLTL